MFRSPCDDLAAGNRDRPAGAAVAAADARCARAARRSHGATRNRNGAAGAVDAAADAGAGITACCIDHATGNGNVAACRRAAAADAGAAVAADGRHLATRNLDDAARRSRAAADASAAAGRTGPPLAGGLHNSAGNGDRAKTTIFRRPYAGPKVSAVCLDGAALDFQAAGRRTGRAADAGRLRAARRRHLASAADGQSRAFANVNRRVVRAACELDYAFDA